MEIGNQQNKKTQGHAITKTEGSQEGLAVY